MVEFPAVMYLIFIGLLVPLIGLATFGYRIAMIYFATRDACYKAAISSTFGTVSSSPPGAVANAASTWNRDVAAWHGISGNETIYIVQHPINGSAETLYTAKLTAAQVNTQANMYFIRLIAQCNIQPFFPTPGGWQGMAVPGLTTQFPITMKYQTYVENTSGLTQ